MDMTIEMTPVSNDGFGKHPSTPHWEPYKYKALGRDSQQRREYRSEWEMKKVLPEERMSNPAMLGFLRKVSTDKWFVDRFGKVKFKVQFSRRRKQTAVCNRKQISVYGQTLAFDVTLKFPGNGCMNHRITALHELMHVPTHRQGHGPIYCSALLQTVTHYMGVVAGKELRRQFGINGVQLVR